MVHLTEKIILSRARAQDLNGVKTLNCWGNELTDVSILKDVPNVEVINASVNKIENLEAFSCCLNLKELYLRRNKIKSIEELAHLEDLKNLKFLWLSGNPFCESLSSEDYRLTVIKMLPQIQKLDNNVITSSELQMALQSTLESRDTEAAPEDENGVLVDTIPEEICVNSTNLSDSIPLSNPLETTKDSLESSKPVQNGSSLDMSSSLTKTSDSNSMSTKSTSLSIPRSKSPDMSKLSKSFSDSPSTEVLRSIPAEEPTSSLVASKEANSSPKTESPRTSERKPSPKTEISDSSGEPAFFKQFPLLPNKITSSLTVADSLEETNKLRRELGLQPISPEKYSQSITQPYKPPKKSRKHSARNNILKASLSLVEELDVVSLLTLQDAIQVRLERFELDDVEEETPRELLPS